jgi:hypothetical protein
MLGCVVHRLLVGCCRMSREYPPGYLAELPALPTTNRVPHRMVAWGRLFKGVGRVTFDSAAYPGTGSQEEVRSDDER